MTVSLTAYTKSYEKNCFREHILESISINRERKKVYSQLTEGRSNKIFNTLIGYEILTLGPAAYFDFKALEYQRKGMDLFCHEFMSMERAPDFDPNNRHIPPERFRPFDWTFYKNRLAAGLQRKDYHEVQRASSEALIELKEQPNYYCMTRHMFESIYRFSYFGPKRSEQAKEMDLQDPKDLILSLAKLHLLGLRDAHRIDLLAQPLQQGGIPILCAEIPDLLFDLNAPELEILKK
jgi:hypothetical protein